MQKKIQRLFQDVNHGAKLGVEIQKEKRFQGFSDQRVGGDY
jgi:hypothetical protein